MTSKKGVNIYIIVALASCFICSGLAVLLTAYLYGTVQFNVFSTYIEDLVEQHPQLEQDLLFNLKMLSGSSGLSFSSSSFLERYGYQRTDFLLHSLSKLPLLSMGVFLIGTILLLGILFILRKHYLKRIENLTEHLEKINTNQPGTIIPAKEDAFSHLQDEIYKTVTTLYQTRDAAMDAKENFALNLTNIAHQLKTPIAAASISIQLQEQISSSDYIQQIKKQLTRLTMLEESLLLLSQIDAGTLTLKMEEMDVYTVLNLAIDNLDVLIKNKKNSITLPEHGCVAIRGDLDWTMEALMNLIKNCLEHSPTGGTIHCDYDSNPLYTVIQIWDEGSGFDSQDIPHLFERFYRGRTATSNGIGIGLSFSKAIFEMEKGYITAYNRPDGGACFEVRIYSH